MAITETYVAIDALTAQNTDEDLTVIAGGTKKVVSSILIVNEYAGAVTVEIIMTNTSNTKIAQILPETTITEKNFRFFDIPVTLSDDAKIRVQGSQLAISFLGNMRNG
jgi:hypothetical protein